MSARAGRRRARTLSRRAQNNIAPGRCKNNDKRSCRNNKLNGRVGIIRRVIPDRAIREDARFGRVVSKAD